MMGFEANKSFANREWGESRVQQNFIIRVQQNFKYPGEDVTYIFGFEYLGERGWSTWEREVRALAWPENILKGGRGREP